MSLDIREGDLLVMNGREFPILFCGVWKTRIGSTPSMKRMCSETASTKRPPAVVGAVRGLPVTNLTGIKCTPLDPVGQRDLAVRNLPIAPTDARKTIIDGGDTFYEVYVENIRK